MIGIPIAFKRKIIIVSSSFLNLSLANASGGVLNKITEEGFKISGLLSFHFTPTVAHELMDVYSTIFPSYSLMIDQLCIAPSMAVMVTGSEGN